MNIIITFRGGIFLESNIKLDITRIEQDILIDALEVYKEYLQKYLLSEELNDSIKSYLMFKIQTVEEMRRQIRI